MPRMLTQQAPPGCFMDVSVFMNTSMNTGVGAVCAYTRIRKQQYSKVFGFCKPLMAVYSQTLHSMQYSLRLGVACILRILRARTLYVSSVRLVALCASHVLWLPRASWDTLDAPHMATQPTLLLHKVERSSELESQSEPSSSPLEPSASASFNFVGFGWLAALPNCNKAVLGHSIADWSWFCYTELP